MTFVGIFPCFCILQSTESISVNVPEAVTEACSVMGHGCRYEKELGTTPMETQQLYTETCYC